MKLALQAPQLKFFSVRLGALDYSTHDAIIDLVPLPLSWTKWFAQNMTPVLKRWDPAIVCRSQDFGRILVSLALSNGVELKVKGASNDGHALGARGFASYPSEGIN